MINVLIMLLFLSAMSVAHPGKSFTRFAGFSLDHATLTDVQSRYGNSPRLEAGEGGEYEAWVCYSTPTAEVQFKSGELGGGTQLLAFGLRKLSSTSKCPKPTKQIRPSIGGVTLGITRQKFVDIVGSHVTWYHHMGKVIFEHQTKSSEGVVYDVSVTVIGTFRRGRLTKLEVWKVETN